MSLMQELGLWFHWQCYQTVHFASKTWQQPPIFKRFVKDGCWIFGKKLAILNSGRNNLYVKVLKPETSKNRNTLLQYISWEGHCSKKKEEINEEKWMKNGSPTTIRTWDLKGALIECLICAVKHIAKDFLAAASESQAQMINVFSTK